MQLEDSDHSSSEENSLPSERTSKKHGSTWTTGIRKFFRRRDRRKRGDKRTRPPLGDFTKSELSVNGSIVASRPSNMPTRTLQRYHGGPNEERTEYMEMHSSLRAKGLVVSVEQVSIFLTDNNTVVSFFEQSAEDIETPIINRLISPETVLRRTSDASMIVQAIIDAIIDLAIPVSAAYKDAIDELELNVLTEPAIENASALYIIISEISQFRYAIFPVINLVNALRDHKSEPIRTPGLSGFPEKTSSTGLKISPWTYTYLGDVEDHIILITDNLGTLSWTLTNRTLTVARSNAKGCGQYDRSHIQYHLCVPERIYEAAHHCNHLFSSLDVPDRELLIDAAPKCVRKLTSSRDTLA